MLLMNRNVGLGGANIGKFTYASATVSDKWYGRAIGMAGNGKACLVGHPYLGNPDSGGIWRLSKPATTWTSSSVTHSGGLGDYGGNVSTDYSAWYFISSKYWSSGPNYYLYVGTISSIELIIDNGTLSIGRTLDMAGTGDRVIFDRSTGPAVYADVYSRSGSTWSLEQSIQGSTQATGTTHMTVTMNHAGDTCAFAALDTSGDEQIYVFTRSGTVWTEQQILQGSDWVSGDHFGCTTSGDPPDGNWLVKLSANGDTLVAIATSAKAAYIFDRTGGVWSETQIIDLSSEFTVNCCDISGDGSRVVFGTSPSYNEFEVLVYDKVAGTYSLSSTIDAVDSETGDGFGYSLGLSDDGLVLIVGAYLDDISVTDQGSAYIFNL